MHACMQLCTRSVRLCAPALSITWATPRHACKGPCVPGVPGRGALAQPQSPHLLQPRLPLTRMRASCLQVGTPYYVSPEVVRGAGYDWKSDVWSMGCLLYELACLRSPFEMEGANLYDVFQKISKVGASGALTHLHRPLLRALQRMADLTVRGCL